MTEQQQEQIKYIVEKIKDYYNDLYTYLENFDNISDEEWVQIETMLSNLYLSLCHIEDEIY